MFTRFGFEEQVQRLDEANALYLVLQRFAAIDLSPDHVSNTEMGTVFEELIRKFAEASDETAGEHFTPREVIALMVDLLLVGDEDATVTPNIILTVYDPAAGTGGMLSTMDEHLRTRTTPRGSRWPSGDQRQFLRRVQGRHGHQRPAGRCHRARQHAHRGRPRGRAVPLLPVQSAVRRRRKTSEREVRKEHTQLGFQGRFGPGLPAVSDGRCCSYCT